MMKITIDFHKLSMLKVSHAHDVVLKGVNYDN